MKKNVVCWLGLATGLLSLTACVGTEYSDAEKDYLSSVNGQNIVVPRSLSRDQINHDYDLPAQNKNPVISTAPPVSKNLLT